MSRNGCQPSNLSKLVQLCDQLSVPVDAIFTHLADPWDNATFTKMQMNNFYNAIQPFKGRAGIKFHTSGSGATIRGYGTELDFVRPGISIYGLPPAGADEEFVSCGLKPALSLRAMPTLVKQCGAGSKVGYSCTYECTSPEWIATIPLGYGDGYHRCLSSIGVVRRDATGEKCPVVGRVSMDAITIRLPSPPIQTESFTVITDDYDPDTSACGLATKVGTISYEIMTSLSSRFPRVYTDNGEFRVVYALDKMIY